MAQWRGWDMDRWSDVLFNEQSDTLFYTEQQKSKMDTSKLRAPSTFARAKTASDKPKEKEEFPVNTVTSKNPANSLASRRAAPSVTAAARPTRPIAKVSRPTSASAAQVAKKQTVPLSTAVGTNPGANAEGPPAKRKRAAWDVKGRLEDMEQHSKDTVTKLDDSQRLIDGLTDKLNEGQEQINQLVDFKQSLESQFQMKQVENGEMAGKLRNIEDELENTRQKHSIELSSVKAQYTKELSEASTRESSLQSTLNETQARYSSLQSESRILQSTISSHSSTIVSLESQIRSSTAKSDAMERVSIEKDRIIKHLEERCAASEARVNELESDIRSGEVARRRLHNMVQELKGNVRVFCRIRPPLKSEQSIPVLSHIKLNPQDDKSMEIISTGDSSAIGGSSTTVTKSYPFSFDKIFPPTTTQLTVFDEISQLVQSALDGYNVCIFAYGQTGSGKTYTMEGGKDAADIGVIPRAVSQVFEAAVSLEAKGWSYSFETSFLEIYNESIRDLLVTSSSAAAAGINPKYDIKHEAGVTRVTDLTVVPVTKGDEVRTLLRRASTNRAVAATNSNEHSSRSHSVFTLRLRGTNSITGESCEGTLNLIDLAGSERLSVSGSTGDRLKETQAINKSLSALGDVIFALGGKDAGGHVPYRNSKVYSSFSLTYLLQNSLGGNSKTLMFVNVSPLTASFGETLCSLRFATKVNSCQIGTAKAVKK
ncbi:testis kinesin-like protein KIFC1 [Chytriomyces cf. hyalinus JEL632]|nr:testis kinesin-like protein KIFC1 [Chytriomyces cf. hyalinus JEL632]